MLMQRDSKLKRLIVALLCAAATCLGGAHAAEAELPGIDDQPDHAVRLEADGEVMTRGEGTPCTFVANAGAVLRHGTMRLVASRMVVWFSPDPGGKSVSVLVYAEGLGSADGAVTKPVQLIRGDDVQECAAVFLRLRSHASFAWDCQTVKAGAAAHSALLARAEAVTKNLTAARLWKELPAAEELPDAPEIKRLLRSNESHTFEDQVAVHLGDVRTSFGVLDLRADAAVLWYDEATGEFELYAEGDVRLSMRPSEDKPLLDLGMPIREFKAEQVYISPGMMRARATSVAMRLQAPVGAGHLVLAVRGQELQAVDGNTLTVRKFDASTCPMARPHYRISAGKARISRQGQRLPLTLQDVRLRVGERGWAALKLPFVGLDASMHSFLLRKMSLGSSGGFGFTTRTTWGPMDVVGGPPGWMEYWDVYLDHYAKRGMAVGTSVEYAFGPRDGHAGRIRGYRLRDAGDEDKETGLPVPREVRGRLHWRHRSRLAEELRLDMEYYYLSDEGFLREYFEDDFESEKPPESYALLRHLGDSSYVALLYKDRQNDFLQQLQETPSLTAAIAAVPIGRFVYEGYSAIGQYELLPPELDGMGSPTDYPELQRAHTDHRVSLPFSVGFLRLSPFVRAAGTWAEQRLDADGDFEDAEAERILHSVGGTLSATFWRTYGVKSRLLGLNRLRHIISLHAGVERISLSHDGSRRFIQMDEWDELDDEKISQIGLRNRLLTKRLLDGRWTSVDWMELDVTYVARDSDSVNTTRAADYVRANFEWRLAEWLDLHSRDNRFFVHDEARDSTNVGFGLDVLPAASLSLDYDHIEDVSRTLTAELALRLSDHYDLIVSEEYERDEEGTGESGSVETEVSLRRRLCQWALEVGVKVDEAKDDTTLMIGFGPLTGWKLFADDDRR
jgi:hypothetical protein